MFKRIDNGVFYDSTKITKEIKYTSSTNFNYYTGSYLSSGSKLFPSSSNNPYLIYKTINQLYYNNSIYNNEAKFNNYIPTSSISIYKFNINQYAEGITPTTFKYTSSTLSIIDDGYYNLMLSGSSTYIGNIFYNQGIAVITNQNYLDKFSFNTSSYFSYYNSLHLNTLNTIITLEPYDFNMSYNPTYTSSISPYFNNIGLYNDNKDLLAVVKLATPIQRTDNTTFNVYIRIDI